MDWYALQDFGPPKVRKRKGVGGPTSAEGKKRCSQNARKHGCRSKQRILPGERKTDYDALWEEWLELYRPGSAVEISLLERVVDAAWRLRRSERALADVERMLRKVSKNAAEWPENLLHRLQVMQRYRTSDENSFYKAVRNVEFLKSRRETELREMERRLRREQDERARWEKEHPEAAKARRKAEQELAEAAVLKSGRPGAGDGDGREPVSRAKQLFQGQNSPKKRKKVARLEQWVEIRIVDGRTVTELYPSNEKLMERGKGMLPPPELVYRRLNFPDGIPAEYDWVGVQDEEHRKLGGMGVQRMTVDTWLELIDEEAAQPHGHLLPTFNLPRPEEHGPCDCPVCVTNAEILRMGVAEEES